MIAGRGEMVRETRKTPLTRGFRWKRTSWTWFLGAAEHGEIPGQSGKMDALERVAGSVFPGQSKDPPKAVAFVAVCLQQKRYKVFPGQRHETPIYILFRENKRYKLNTWSEASSTLL